jgi:hypothetical protein
MSKWMPEIAPDPGDIKVVSFAQDRFYNTDLDKMLKRPRGSRRSS